jgi:hypothetical protein
MRPVYMAVQVAGKRGIRNNNELVLFDVVVKNGEGFCFLKRQRPTQMVGKYDCHTHSSSVSEAVRVWSLARPSSYPLIPVTVPLFHWTLSRAAGS